MLFCLFNLNAPPPRSFHQKITYNSANHKSRNRKNSISHQQPHYKTHISTSPFYHFSACANNKTPVPDGHFILTADRQEQHLLFCCHLCPVLLIPDLLFHDDAGLELYLYPVRRDYFDAGNQPSDMDSSKFSFPVFFIPASCPVKKAVPILK